MFATFGKKYKATALISVGLLSALPLAVSPAHAAGDLLVAPTRIVLDGRRGTEVILNNIGNEEATYRISLELRRMNKNGKLEEVSEEAVNEKETAIRNIIRYAPRRVTSPPNQPQSIRIGVNSLQEVPDGEYRAHMLFRAIPRVTPVTQSADENKGVQIQLNPIYGVTIPIIVRKGKLEATAALANPRVETDEEGNPVFRVDMSRQGNGSVFGEIRVTTAGAKEPIVFRGIAVYPELDSRIVTLPLTSESVGRLKGPVTVGYYMPIEDGGALLAEVKALAN